MPASTCSHLSGVVCLDPASEPRVAPLLRHAPTIVPASPPLARRQSRTRHTLTLADPDSSSIVGRRASGFLQVSLSKVSRHRQRGARPASCAETPPMNANDYTVVQEHRSPSTNCRRANRDRADGCRRECTMFGPVGQIGSHHNVSPASIYTWRRLRRTHAQAFYGCERRLALIVRLREPY